MPEQAHSDGGREMCGRLAPETAPGALARAGEMSFGFRLGWPPGILLPATRAGLPTPPASQRSVFRVSTSAMSFSTASRLSTSPMKTLSASTVNQHRSVLRPSL